MSGCLGPHSPCPRASCSHFSIPAPLIHLKAIPPSPLFSPPSPSLIPTGTFCLPSLCPYFSHLVQPIPALCHLFHLSCLPLQDHINTLGCCSCSLVLLSLAPEPCLVASMFLLVSAISAVLLPCRTVPASPKTSCKSLWPVFGVYWDSSRQFHFQRKKPTLHFHHP